MIYMGANNFYPHENGIFVIEEPTFEDTYELIKEFNEDLDQPEEITDDEVYAKIGDDFSMLLEEYLSELLLPALDAKGYETVQQNDYLATVYSKGRIVAELSIESGYYQHAQVIVETDKDVLIERYIFGDGAETVTEEREVYTPHHKRLLKLVGRYTTPIVRVGGFSNGEAIYQKV
jgi:hypothetical protein